MEYQSTLRELNGKLYFNNWLLTICQPPNMLQNPNEDEPRQEKDFVWWTAWLHLLLFRFLKSRSNSPSYPRLRAESKEQQNLQQEKCKSRRHICQSAYRTESITRDWFLFANLTWAASFMINSLFHCSTSSLLSFLPVFFWSQFILCNSMLNEKSNHTVCLKEKN